MEDYKNILEKQREFFNTGETLPVTFRIEQLKKLKTIVEIRRADITAALKKDLNKPVMESLLTELTLFTEESSLIIKNLKQWAKPKRVHSPFPEFFPGKSKIYYEPYGVVLIIGPWNYPFQLIMSPLMGAICAGNCAIIKPSEVSTHTQTLLINLINEHFPSEYIKALPAGPTETEKLLKEKFDYIFFVGSTRVGKMVMKAAAEHLTPLTLELGGKSPCIIDATANLDYAARRIVWGKMINAGQTCLAPDFLYVQNSIKAALIEKIQEVIASFYGPDPMQSESYGRIINQNHFQRLKKLLNNGKIVFGGQTNAEQLYISPTLIDDISLQDEIMQEEIFGPILPIMTFDNLDEIIKQLRTTPKPLALYYFTQDQQAKDYILSQLSFGGGCINDCVMHVANFHLPFGGVGMSGIGAYHGQYSFETFSHRKSMLEKYRTFDLNLQYPPYSKKKWWWIKRLLGV